jgi:beta-galactosidase
MRSLLPLNDNWVFHDGCDQKLLTAPAPGETARLPHTAVELPFAYFDEGAYQRTFTYQRVVRSDPAWTAKEVSLVFDGVMANARVYINGEQIAAHKDGYTPFEARLTGKLKSGDNLVTVRIDGSENPEVPPFGGRIDYLTYAGIYRVVWL